MIVSNEEIPKCVHVVILPEVLTRRIIFVRDAFVFQLAVKSFLQRTGFAIDFLQ